MTGDEVMIMKNKFKLTATSVLLLTSTLTHTASAVTLTQNEIDIIAKHHHKDTNLQGELSSEEFSKIMNEYDKRIKEEERKRIKSQQQEFFYIVNHNDVTLINLTTPSGLTPEIVNSILEGTGLQGLGQAFVDAEQKNGVNAYYLMAHAAWESSWGKSKIAQSKNNLFGFTAYDASPEKSATAFSTKAECIDIVANYVKEHYLNTGGKYNNGPHLKGMNIMYASDKEWASGIGNLMIKFVSKAKGSNI